MSNTTKTDAKTEALKARGIQAAKDGLLGFELDRALEAEGMDRASHTVVRLAFNDALETLY